MINGVILQKLHFNRIINKIGSIFKIEPILLL